MKLGKPLTLQRKQEIWFVGKQMDIQCCSDDPAPANEIAQRIALYYFIVAKLSQLRGCAMIRMRKENTHAQRAVLQFKATCWRPPAGWSLAGGRAEMDVHGCKQMLGGFAGGRCICHFIFGNCFGFSTDEFKQF